MKKVIITITSAIIILGVVGVGLNTIFGYGSISFITRENINGIWIYKYNFWNYISEVKNAVTDVARLELKFWDREWITANTWEAQVNNMAFMIDTLIFFLNILIYPFRIGGYVLQIIGSFLGMPVLTYTDTNPLKWLYKTMEVLVNAQVPYI